MIFQRKTVDEKASAFVGAFLPASLVEKLTLFALSKGVSKTSILRYLIENGLRQCTKEPGIDSLCTAVAQNARQIWIRDQSIPKSDRKYENYNDFLDSCTKELRAKKDVSHKSIERITKQLEEYACSAKEPLNT